MAEYTVQIKFKVEAEDPDIVDEMVDTKLWAIIDNLDGLVTGNGEGWGWEILQGTTAP